MGRPKSISRDEGHPLPGGGTLYWHAGIVRKGVGFPTISHFLLQLGGDVGTGLIAAYLYDKLTKGRATKLRIDRTEVEIDEGEITRVIEEHIEEH
jgi:hypothetical protein